MFKDKRHTRQYEKKWTWNKMRKSKGSVVVASSHKWTQMFVSNTNSPLFPQLRQKQTCNNSTLENESFFSKLDPRKK